MISSKKLSTLTLAPLFSLLLLAAPVQSADTTASSALAGLAQQASSLSEGSLDINSATPELLAAIPGIGQQISEAIVKYREGNGAFKNIQELLNIEGIDEGLIEKIGPFLKF